MNGRRWTPEEDDQLVATIGRPAVDVAIQLGRSTVAVEQRRARLFTVGALTARGRHPIHALRTWTADDDAIVRATVAHPIGEVAARIPAHTSEAIRARRRTLRLLDEPTR